MRLLSGAAFSLAVILGCFFLILSRGRLYPFFNPPSVVVMLFFTLGNLLAGPGPGGLARAFAAIGGRGKDGSSSQARRRAAAAFDYLNTAILLAGSVAFLTGVVYFLHGLNDRMRYGPTMALALVAVFQAILLLVCVGLPLKAAAGSDAAESRVISGR
jgi:flagellar motor component MotA